jgi:2',3'-cyclic-nucleotide 2'-phosphodiesterase (5'-nucleotidase family)
MKKIFLLFPLYLFVLTNFSYSQENVKEVTILHYNDLHARNLPYKVTKKDSVKGEYQVYVGGISNMLGYIKKNRDSKTLLLNGGDDYQGSPISTITRGYSQIELMNLFNLDAFVVGNHEFDYGQYTLDSALQGANFNYLSANVYLKSLGRNIGKPYIIKEVNGVKTGIIGLTAIDLMTLVVPKNISDVVVLDTDSVVALNIAELKSQNCDLIILLTHIGVENDKKLAEKFAGDVDVIIGGHSHTPLFKPVRQNGVVITQAGSYSRWLGKLDLKVDTDKDTVISSWGNLIETVMDSSIYDRAAQEKVEGMVASIQPELDRVIGVLKTDWKRSYTDESNLGQWEADAVRHALETDIAFLNSGGIRKDLSRGNITVGDIWEINPFGNTIVTFNASGRMLKEMIKNNARIRYKEIKEQGSADMIVVSGITVTYDSEKIGMGSEDFITQIAVNGEPLDDNKTYTIATNNYVGAQFKKYFGEPLEALNITDSNIIDRDLFIEAVQEQKVIESLLETRIRDISTLNTSQDKR